MTVKRITIRVSPKLHEQPVQLSVEQDKSLNTVAVEESPPGMQSPG